MYKYQVQLGGSFKPSNKRLNHFFVDSLMGHCSMSIIHDCTFTQLYFLKNKLPSYKPIVLVILTFLFYFTYIVATQLKIYLVSKNNHELSLALQK